MNLKRGLSLLAFGFLFTLVNFNLTVNGFKINIIPDCIGWLLFFLAFGSLGVFSKGFKWLRWVALLLAVITAGFWALETFKPELAGGSDYTLLSNIVSIGELVFTILIFTPLIRIAEEYGSKREGTLKTLRILDVIAYLLVVASGIYVVLSARGAEGVEYLSGTTVFASVLMIGAGIMMLVCAIITVVTVFGLRREVIEKTF